MNGGISGAGSGGDGQYDLSAAPAVEWRDAAARERYAAERGRYLDRRTDGRFQRRHCLALAWRELGFSTSGIAKRVDSTEATVESWLAIWADEYGREVLESRPQSAPVEVLE